MGLTRDEYVRNAALHEAAHALAFSQGGLAVYSIRVHDPDDERCAGAVLVDEADAEDDEQFEALLLGSLTGCAATARYLTDELDWDPDAALEYAVDCSQSDLSAFAEQAGEQAHPGDFERAEQWVEACWDDIEDLAEQVLDAGGVVTAASVL